MDLVSRPLDHSSRAASAEPSSTRPNPFDDGDVSSRKRRRTSLSGSPVTSSDTMNPIHESSRSTTLEGEPDASDRASAAEAYREPITPQTPEQRCDSQEPPTEPSSSMVTLNLRNAPHNDGASSSPVSPSPSAKGSAHNAIPGEPPNTQVDNVKTSVEDHETDLAAPESLDTPQSSSSCSEVPSIEVITVPSDEDMTSGRQSVDLSMSREGLVLVDPVPDFPFNDAEESLAETVHRLTQYFSTRETPCPLARFTLLNSAETPIEETVIDNIQQWLEQYLRYVKDAGQEAAWESCRVNRSFWQVFPEVIMALSCRKPPMVKAPGLRSVVMDLYPGFAKLTAWFITFDHHTIEEFLSTQGSQDRRGPDFLSMWYLQPLHTLTRPRFISEQETELSSPRSDDALYLIKEFQDSQGGSIACLAQFATGVVGLIPEFPRLADSLAPICQIAADIMGDSTLVLYTPQGVSTSKQRLEIGHQLHNLVLDALTTMIEKHVTQLSCDSLTSGIQALSDMLRLSLQGHHQNAIEMLLEHQQLHPNLPHSYTAEAIVCEKRFNILTKLIRSSQMQLRVMGVTTMCGDLVACWKRYSDPGEESSAAYLNHLAEHLLHTELIEYILGPNCHPEITVESANIIGFLVVTRMYRDEHTDLLWQGITSSQDPRVADALTRMVNTIINLFDYNGLLGLCGKLHTLPIEGFTPAIRLLWENVVRHLVSRSSVDRATLSFHPYDLCLRLLRESSICGTGSQVAHPEMQHAAMQKFKELLAYGPDPEGRQQLYQSCIKDIAEQSNTTLGSLWCLSMAIRPAVATEVHVLTEKHNLAKLIVNELEHAIESGRVAGVPAVLYGGTNQPRRDFIAHIIQLEPQTISGDLGAKLWAMLVGPRSPCLDDRRAGWSILNTVKQSSFRNPFLQTCLSQYLPLLPPSCFCDGMLEFVRDAILPRLNETGDLVLDDRDSLAASGVEELWRLILEADDVNLVDQSIRTLAVEVYIESRHILGNSVHRTRLIHLALVGRCLRQLKEAARTIKASSEGTMSGDDEPMVIVATEEQVQEQERIFTRSLKFLRFFLEAHQSKPLFAAPDLRTLISQAPYEVEGDSAELKYQSFDGSSQTDVRPLSIGKLNTAASLLASLKQETGFDNYRVYYRGQPFLPKEHEICQSLEELHVHDGLILVKREEDGPSYSAKVKPGASPLEVEISAHFDEMWEYLSMEEKLAQEIYHFLVKLPTDGHILQSINSDGSSHRDVFPPGQPFKSLYAVHALLQYTEAALHGRISAEGATGDGPSGRLSQPVPYIQAVKTSILLVVQAISDEDVLDHASLSLRLTLTGALVHSFLRFLEKLDTPRGSFTMHGIEAPTPGRLVDILSNAIACPDEAPMSLIAGTLAAIIRLSFLDGEFWEKLTASSAFSSLLQRMLLTDTRSGVRAVTAKMIEERLNSDLALLTDSSSTTADGLRATALTNYFWAIVSDLVPETARSPGQCDEVFRLAHSLLLKMRTRSPELLNTPQLASRTSQLLLDHVSTENISQVGFGDLYAKGLTSLLHLCLQVDGPIAISSNLPPTLAQDLLWKHLYPTKRSLSEQPVPKILLNAETRAKLSEIVFSLVKNDKEKIYGILRSLISLVPFYADDEDDPYLYELPYNFERSKALRAPCGYVGLQNLSNTCYLNSLLTQLFMNTSFRGFMMNSRVRDPGNTQQLLFYTQKLFGYMQESYRRFVDPTNVVNSIKTYDDTLIDIHNQMDVDEFYNLLFDRWEGQLLDSDERKRLRSFYGGQLVQQVKSKECEHISERLEPFSAIQCDIKGKSTLEDSLQAYVDGEIMEGGEFALQNDYLTTLTKDHRQQVQVFYLRQTRRRYQKASLSHRDLGSSKLTKSRACLKDIPDNVIFHLKRFDFNLRTLQRSKINDYFSFPARVNMRPYTIEHLSQPENEDEEDIFELVGVLVHSGTAESGHYYSYIRERPSTDDRQGWVEFNDDMVTPWDPAMMESSTFGGPDHRPPYDSNGIMYDKTYSAYMLFYQRASSLRAEQEAMPKLSVPAPLRVEVAETLKDHILDENTVILRRHCLFDPSHMRLVQMLFSQSRVLHHRDLNAMTLDQEAGESPPSQPYDHDLKDLAMETVISNFDQVVTRAKDIPDFPVFSTMIRDAIVGCPQCALSFFDYFSRRPEAFRSLLQRNPDVNVRLFVSKMFIWALEKITISLPTVYDPSNSRHGSSEMDEDGNEVSLERDRSQHSVLSSAMNVINHLWRYFHIHIRAWDEYFATILGFARLGSRETAYLLAGDYLARLLRIVSADPMMELPPNYARMLHNVMRRINTTRAPSYLAIIALISHLMQQLEPKLGSETIVDDPTERLDHMEAPFNWTAHEVELVHTGLDGNASSLFMEKLLAIDQGHEQTDGIFRFLVGTNVQMDTRALGTLKRCIRGDTSTQAMDPFLRVASVYIESTEQVENATRMVQHIFLQAKSLQNSEGSLFLNFFKTALNLKRQDETLAETVRAFSLKLVPKWGPYLLVYQDMATRTSTEDFLEREVLHCAIPGSPVQEGSQARRDVMVQTAKQLGLMCLVYLQENHVRRRVSLRRDMAGMILHVIARCATVIDSDPETQDEVDIDFLSLQREVLDPLRRLIVDDVEEEGSGMLQSFSDSDTITADLA
ncbi:hypothetical protein AK830_g3489 [Neonectria ditissima]|uniref:USP domain-containing protein n=1 Tax=Neonectria ditissima TaxID=78410 RepID=A0A0P7BRT3_9HYPO|nr:hypothetical protein AK830_g3489 [Neonectria ditissima]